MAAFTLETDPEIVLRALRPLLMPVYEVLEIAIPRALEIVTENGWTPSGHLVSHLTRAEAKKLLDGRNCPVEFDDSPRSLEMQRVAMEGLATKFDGLTIKILKGAEIPRASTKPRQEFYQQSSPGLWVGGQAPPILNLVVLWTVLVKGVTSPLIYAARRIAKVKIIGWFGCPIQLNGCG
jgi:hypothetical protein